MEDTTTTQTRRNGVVGWTTYTSRSKLRVKSKDFQRIPREANRHLKVEFGVMPQDFPGNLGGGKQTPEGQSCELFPRASQGLWGQTDYHTSAALDRSASMQFASNALTALCVWKCVANRRQEHLVEYPRLSQEFWTGKQTPKGQFWAFLFQEFARILGCKQTLQGQRLQTDTSRSKLGFLPRMSPGFWGASRYMQGKFGVISQGFARILGGEQTDT